MVGLNSEGHSLNDLKCFDIWGILKTSDEKHSSCNANYQNSVILPHIFKFG